MYSLTVLEARNPKSKCRQTALPPKALEEHPSYLFQLLVAPDISWLVAESVTQISAFDFAGLLLLSRASSPYKDTSHEA